MLKTNSLFTKCTLGLFLFLGVLSYSQVKIGTTLPATPAGGALLDLDDTTKGFLAPRVNIANLNTIAPVTGGSTTGLLVWNTNTGTGVGFHYWNGSVWVPLGGSGGSDDWHLIGNTALSTDFLGTINGVPLNIRTTNAERMRVQANGQVTVGFAAANANPGDALSAVGTTGVAGYSGGTGTGVYGQNIAGGNGVFGLNNSTGNAVFALSLSTASGDALHAEHDGSGDAVNGVNFGTGAGVYGENFFFTNYSVYGVDGIFSVFGENNFGFDGVVGLTNDIVSNGVWARNDNAIGTGVLGGSNNLHVYNTNGSGVAGSGTHLGVFGYAGAGASNTANRGNAAGRFDLDTDSNVTTTTGNNGTRASSTLAGYDNISPNGTLGTANSYFGGYFLGGNINSGPSYAYAGIKYNASANGTMGTNYKIIGNGTNSTIITDSNNVPRILFSPEAPEILFEDYGTGQLTNGVAEIVIDPILRDAIYVDENHPLKVFIQLEGDCNGVYVTNKSENGFTVKELQNGTSNVPFSWHIVANRADDTNQSGEVTSTHVGLRFPVGPAPLKEQKVSQKKLEDVQKRSADIKSKKRPIRELNIDEPTQDESGIEINTKITTKVEPNGH